jgi:serine/threonine protein kinase
VDCSVGHTSAPSALEAAKGLFMGNGKSRPGGGPGSPRGEAAPGHGATAHGASGASGAGATSARPTGGEVAATGAPTSAADDEMARASSGVLKAALEDFDLLKTVGKGSFGKVVQVRHRTTGKIYAMKILKKEMVLKRKQFEHTLAERRILENINHPFIVSLRFAFQTEHKLYMVFDFFNGGELYFYLSEGGAFGEERARFYAAEIASALAYLHKRGIVYRDLKPENLILDSNGHIRITDFGLSKEGVEGESITSICGTPEYLAPEILRKKPHGAGVDWWSLGTLVWEMIMGLPPFYDKSRQTMYRKILEAPLERPASGMSADAFDFCSKMLARDPKKRLGYGGGDEVLSHPFFKSINMADLMAMKLPPPWVPAVAGPEDTGNIAPEFTAEPAAVTPSPAGGRLKDATGATPPSFRDFTFTHASVIDGKTYRVSFSSEDGALLRDDGSEAGDEMSRAEEIAAIMGSSKHASHSKGST